MQGVFEKLTANEDYLEWKSSFSSTAVNEKLDGDSIVFSAKGEEGVNGDYSFTLDGDYIVNTAAELKNAIRSSSFSLLTISRKSALSFMPVR